MTKLTIYLNGFVIDGDDSYPFLQFDGTCDLTLTNRNIEHPDDSHYLDSSGDLAIELSETGRIQNCKGDDGAVIYFEYINNAKITLQNIVFRDNVAEFGGSVVYAGGLNCELTAKGCVFERNGSLWTGGGAINLYDSSTCNISYCEFSGNHGLDFGGALYAGADNMINISHCLFENNFASQNGGAVHVGDNTNLQVNNTVFSSNEAGVQGGAIWQRDSVEGKIGTGVLKIENCKFDSNSAYEFGGAVQTKDINEIVINNSDFMRNESDTGGAVSINNTKATLKSCVFSYNKADSYGGAVYLDNPLDTVISGGSTRIEKNEAGTSGGAVYVVNSGTFAIDGAPFTDNTDETKNTAPIGKDISLLDDSTIMVAGNLGTNVYDVAKYASRNHRPGVITSGLSGKGTKENFKSSEGYAVIINSNNEAELASADKATSQSNGGSGNMEEQGRCDGGTIVDYKVPKTGDEGNPMLWLGCVLAGSVMIAVSVYAGKRKKNA